MLGKKLWQQRCHFADNSPYSQSYVFFSSHVQMWELDHKEDWALKNWCFRIVVLKKSLESLSDSKELKPVNPKRKSTWIVIRRTDAEADAPILWSPDANSWFFGKDPDAGKDWGQEEKGTMEDQVVGWPYQLNGHESEQTLGDTEGRRSLVCCSTSQRAGHNLVVEQQQQCVKNI